MQELGRKIGSNGRTLRQRPPETNRRKNSFPVTTNDTDANCSICGKNQASRMSNSMRPKKDAERGRRSHALPLKADVSQASRHARSKRQENGRNPTVLLS